MSEEHARLQKLAAEYDQAVRDLRLAVRKMLVLAHMSGCVEGCGFYAKLCLDQSWHAEDRTRSYLFDNLEDAAASLPTGEGMQAAVKAVLTTASVALRSRVRSREEAALRREGADYRRAYYVVTATIEELERQITNRATAVLYYTERRGTFGPDRYGPLRRAVITRRLKTRIELSSPEDGALRIMYDKIGRRWVDYAVFTAEDVLAWTR